MQVESLDAPILGLDAFSSLDNMPPTAAVVLDNLIPSTGSVKSRGGISDYVDLGTGLPTETVVSLDSTSASKLVAASDGGIFDISEVTVFSPEGPVTERLVQELAPTGTYQSSRWQHKNFRTRSPDPGVQEDGVIILTNGVDPALKYDGTGPSGLEPVDFSGSAVGTPDNFIGCEIYKGRAYYWADDDDGFYYAQAGGYQGELKYFPLSNQVQRGGKIVLMTTWTQQDAGDGRDDFLAIVFETGEILVYQGDDPETVGFFEMVGRYITAEPLSIRGRDKYGSDTILMTRDGYINLASIVQQGRTSDVPQFSRMISGLISRRTQNGSRLFGWDCSLFPKQGLFVFNVPLSDNTFEQHVLNTVTMAWCRFTGINVTCLEVHDDRLFGGTRDGRVVTLLEGTSDLGNPIQCAALPAFNYLNDLGNNKHLVAAQIISTIQTPVSISLAGFADFNYRALGPVAPSDTDLPIGTWSLNPPSPPQLTGSFWDEDYWGNESSPFSTEGWQNVSAYGRAVSVAVRFALVNEPAIWRSTTIRYYSAGAQ